MNNNGPCSILQNCFGSLHPNVFGFASVHSNILESIQNVSIVNIVNSSITDCFIYVFKLKIRLLIKFD